MTADEVAKGTVPINVITGQNASHAEVRMHGGELPRHCLVGVLAIVKKEVDRSERFEQMRQHNP